MTEVLTSVFLFAFGLMGLETTIILGGIGVAVGGWPIESGEFRGLDIARPWIGNLVGDG